MAKRLLRKKKTWKAATKARSGAEAMEQRDIVITLKMLKFYGAPLAFIRLVWLVASTTNVDADSGSSEIKHCSSNNS